MTHKVKVQDVSGFIRALREAYTPAFGNIEVKAMSKKGVVSIIQRGSGSTPTLLIEPIREQFKGEYV